MQVYHSESTGKFHVGATADGIRRSFGWCQKHIYKRDMEWIAVAEYKAQREESARMRLAHNCGRFQVM